MRKFFAFFVVVLRPNVIAAAVCANIKSGDKAKDHQQQQHHKLDTFIISKQKERKYIEKEE